MHTRASIALAATLLALAAGCADPPPSDACARASDCASGERCVSGACVGAPPCDRPEDCAEGLICRDGRCRSGDCAQDEDCGPGLLCADGACEPAPEARCAGDEDCPETQRCDVPSGRCLLPVEPTCGDAAACPAGTACVDGQCRPESSGCATDADCRPGTYCAADGACERGCRTEAGACGADRVCDPDTRTCVLERECDADADCPADRHCADAGRCAVGCRVEPDSCPDGARCDPALRTCAGQGRCAADTQCAPEEFCDAAGECLVGCRLDGCPAPAACDPQSRTCVPPEEACASDADCPAERYCAEAGCVVGCREGGCPDGEACDPRSRTCAAVGGVCAEDTDCPAAQYCDGDACALGCRAGGCGAGERCDAGTRACVCAADLGCPAGRYCAAGVCALGCRVDPSDCPGGGACDPMSRACQCVQDQGCPAGQRCDGGACVPGCRLDPDDCPLGATCVPETRECRCLADPACPAGQYCAAGACVAGCRLDPDDCAAGVCDPETRACRAPACARDADCTPEQACAVLPAVETLAELRCAAALADGRAEAPCGSRFDCASRLCLDQGYCFSACVEDADCPSENCVGVTLVGEDDREFETRSCAPPISRCAADAECEAAQMCVPAQEDPESPGDPLLVCIPAAPGSRTGQPCARREDCASGVCADDVCWGPCRRGEPGHCPEGQRCYDNQVHFRDDQGTPQEADDTFFGFAGCHPDMGSGDPCANGICPAGEVCRLRVDQRLGGFAPQCRAPIGGGAGGAACQQDAQCRSGDCLLGPNICLSVCDPGNPGAQCAAGQRCVRTPLTVWDRGTPTEDDDVIADVFICRP